MVQRALSPAVDFMNNCQCMCHSEPLSCCYNSGIVAILLVVVVFDIGDNDVPTFYLTPAKVFANNKDITLDMSFISLLMKPLSCANIVIGKVNSRDGVAVGGNKCVVYAQGQGIGFIKLFHNYYSFIIDSVHLLSCSIRSSPISPNHPIYGSAHGRLIPAVYSLFFYGDTLLGVCVRISCGHLHDTTACFSCQALFEKFFDFFSAVFGACVRGFLFPLCLSFQQIFHKMQELILHKMQEFVRGWFCAICRGWVNGSQQASREKSAILFIYSPGVHFGNKKLQKVTNGFL